MTTIANVLVGIVALLHLYFLVIEMFLWTTSYGRRVFRLTPEFANASKALAANQGLYNGFLAAGLVCFLTCVIVAGLYGAWTVNRKILYVQALPAIAALVLLHFP